MFGLNKGVLLDAVNKKHKKLRARPRAIDPNNISVLTVGGRSLDKHSHRSNEKFWGKVEGKTEHYKNELAFTIVNQILNECVWFNVHMMPTDEIIVE